MKTLTICATAFNEPYYKQPFISSMLAQTVQRGWQGIVFHNGPNPELRESMKLITNPVYMESEKNTGNWGCENRQTAIEECKTDYILQTSVQDYFLPQAMEYIQKGLEKEPDILIFNSINHLVAPCQVLDAQLAWSKCDWGNVVIKASICKQVPIRNKTAYCGDWSYFSDILNSGLVNTNNILKLNAILTCHN